MTTLIMNELSMNTNLLINSMQQNPSWEANSHSSSQDIPRLLWNPRVHYCAHKNLPMVPILRQKNPVHIFPSYFPKIHSNIFPSTLRSSDLCLPFRFSNQNFICTSHISHACYVPRPSHPSGLITVIISAEAYKLWSSSWTNTIRNEYKFNKETTTACRCGYRTRLNKLSLLLSTTHLELFFNMM